MQFKENIFLLQCLKKEIATAEELDLRQLGKVIIFRYRQTDIIYRYENLKKRIFTKAKLIFEVWSRV